MLRMSLVQSKSFEDKTGSLVRSFIVKLDEPCRRIEPPYRCVLKSAEHNIRVIALPQEIVNCGPLKSGPWLLIVIWADNHDHKVGVVIVKIRKINAKVASRKLCFMKFVIEDFLQNGFSPLQRTARHESVGCFCRWRCFRQQSFRR